MENRNSGDFSKIKIGVSSCLLGEEVRFDGRHKLNTFIKEVLGQYFEFLPLCPEVGSGMGIPREPIRLVRTDGRELKVIGLNSATDYTAKLDTFNRSCMTEFARLRGYLLKSKSPSCGLKGVAIYTQKGRSEGSGSGVFAAMLSKKYPLLPVAEEQSLRDRHVRKNFFERVIVYDRWLTLVESGLTLEKLREFHSRFKLLIIPHSKEACGRLDQLLGQIRPGPIGDVGESYIRVLMDTLKQPTERKHHIFVLERLLESLSEFLNRREKQEMQEILEQYKNAQTPLTVPVDLLRHRFRCHRVVSDREAVYIDLYLHALIVGSANNEA